MLQIVTPPGTTPNSSMSKDHLEVPHQKARGGEHTNLLESEINSVNYLQKVGAHGSLMSPLVFSLKEANNQNETAAAQEDTMCIGQHLQQPPQVQLGVAVGKTPSAIYEESKDQSITLMNPQTQVPEEGSFEDDEDYD